MLRKITISVSGDAARWAHQKAAKENTSVSKFVGRLLEDQMRQSDRYRRAFETIKKIKPIPGFDASKRLRRPEL